MKNEKNSLLGKKVAIFHRYWTDQTSAHYTSWNVLDCGIVKKETDTMVEIDIIKREKICVGFFRWKMIDKKYVKWYCKDGEYYKVEEVSE